MMQTFLPYPGYIQSAAVLDRQRLGKQRVEAKQILLALADSTYGWQNHPAIHMWRGCEVSLAYYGMRVCQEWIKRGYKDSLLPFFEARVESGPLLAPDWLGREAFHTSHKSNLLRKLPAHYRKFWPALPDNLPYVWPVMEN